MTVYICERCQQRFNVANGCTDFIHECDSGDETVDQEDVSVIGSWEDFTGSATVQAAQTQVAGAGNTEFGTDAAIRGADVPEFSVRGRPKGSTRARQHLAYKDLRGKDGGGV